MTQQDYPPDFRSLCAELLEALENAIRIIYNEDGTKHISTADSVIAKADAALAQPEPQGPVPVTERLPGPQDCDAEGKCWWWVVDEPGAFPHWICAPLEAQTWAGYSAWLPHHVLPMPQTL